MRLRTIAACLLLFVSGSVFAADRDGIVLLPFDNFSGVQSAPDEVAALMARELTHRGWRVVEREQVNAILEKERVRYLDSLDPVFVAKILTDTRATALVSGTIYAYSNSRNPIVSISARMVRAGGTIAWSDLAGLSADDTEQILGFGRKSTSAAVAAKVVAQLTFYLPDASNRATFRQSGPADVFLKPQPASFRSSELGNVRRRICVLPFDNASASPEAGRIVTDIVALRLAASDMFELVEPATLRAAALKARIGSFRGIGSDDLAKLASAVGTPLFVRGTVYNFIDPSARPGADAELQLEFALVDITAGRVLWAAQHARKGSDYVGFLMLGRVSNTVSLTDRVVSEIIAAGDRAMPLGAAVAKTARVEKTRTPEKHSELRKRTKPEEK